MRNADNDRLEILSCSTVVSDSLYSGHKKSIFLVTTKSIIRWISKFQLFNFPLTQIIVMKMPQCIGSE